MDKLNLLNNASDYLGAKLKVYKNKILTEVEVLAHYLEGTVPVYIQTNGQITDNFIDSIITPVIDSKHTVYLCLLTHHVTRMEFNVIPHLDVLESLLFHELRPWIVKIVEFLQLSGNMLTVNIIGNTRMPVTGQSIPSNATYPIIKWLPKRLYHRPYLIYKLSAFHKANQEINTLVKRYQNTGLMRKFENKAITNNRFFNKKELRMCPYHNWLTYLWHQRNDQLF